MSHSGSGGHAHGSHGGHSSAVMGHPDQAANWGMSAQGDKRKPLAQTSNPLIVIVISFVLFLALISLPWLLDHIQDAQVAKKNEHGITASATENVQPAVQQSGSALIAPGQLVQQAAESLSQRFGTPRAQNEAMTFTAAPVTQPEIQRSSALPPFRPYESFRRPAPSTNVSDLLGTEPSSSGSTTDGVDHSSYDSYQPATENESAANINDYTGSGSPAQSSSDYGTRAYMPPPLAPNHVSSYAARQQRQLSPSLQAPAEAMAQLLAGKDVSLDSYYASVYGGTPMQDLAPTADHSSQHNIDATSHGGRQGRQPGGVFERHQMFVMR